MPELPEVETIVREMREAHLEGKIILRAQVFWKRTIYTPTADIFCKTIANQKIIKIDRKGKWIVMTLSHDTLLIHLRMTGKFSIVDEKEEPLDHERAYLVLDNGKKLRYEDQRKFGKWHLLRSPTEKLNEIGIEPLSKQFTLSALTNILKNHSQIIKSILLNQQYIAGLGNIYVDESLWEAKIHPKQRSSSLTNTQIKALYKAIPNVLKKGIKNLGTSLGSSRANYFSVSGRRGGNQYKLNVFRQNGLPCPRCGDIITKIIVAQRGTHLCPTCQKLNPELFK